MRRVRKLFNYKLTVWLNRTPGPSTPTEATYISRAGSRRQTRMDMDCECRMFVQLFFVVSLSPTQNIILEPTAYDRLHVEDEITHAYPLPVAKPHFLITKSKSKSSPCSLLWTDLFSVWIFSLGRQTDCRPREILALFLSLPSSYILIPNRGILHLCNSVGKSSLTHLVLKL